MGAIGSLIRVVARFNCEEREKQDHLESMTKDKTRKSKTAPRPKSRLNDQRSKARKSAVDPTSPFFEDKRLYRQAREGSIELYRRLTQSDAVLTDPVRALTASRTNLRVTNTEELDALIRAAELYLDELCQTVVPYLAIPILLQMTTEFYYGSNDRKPIWLGETLKFAIAKTWKNVHRAPLAENKSLAHLAKVISAAAVVHQLYAQKQIFLMAGEGDFTLNETGFAFSHEHKKIIRYFNVSYLQRGAAMRVLDHTLPILFKQPKASVEAIQRILIGSEPSDEALFKGSLFAEFPANCKKFWVHLYLLIFLVGVTHKIAAAFDPDHVSIALFGRMGFIVPGLPSQHADIMRELFWTPDWYQRQHPSWMHDMLVERPILRLQKDKEIFCASSSLLSDSINWFIEATVMSYSNGGVRLPGRLSNRLFRNYISEPFEKSVETVLKEFGFVAGKVTERGNWLLPNETESLTNPNEVRAPGEIDVLAFHPSEMMVLVIECKVLGLPRSVEGMRNQIVKLGLDDAESFHAKLRAKIRWLQGTSLFERLTVDHFIGLVVLDRKAPAMFLQSEFEVIDLETLKNFLKAVVSPKQQELQGET